MELLARLALGVALLLAVLLALALLAIGPNLVTEIGS
jgi:hypothetical protein